MTEAREAVPPTYDELIAQRYAPGGYLGVCIQCEDQFTADKRALRCKACATFNVMKPALTAATERVRVLEAERDALTAVLVRAGGAIWTAHGCALKLKAQMNGRMMYGASEVDQWIDLIPKIYELRKEISAALTSPASTAAEGRIVMVVSNLPNDEAGARAAIKLTAQLPYRQALARILAEPHGCRFCDSGKLRNADKQHDADCGFEMARRLMTQPNEEKR